MSTVDYVIADALEVLITESCLVPAKTPEAEAKRLFHELWGEAQAGVSNYDKAKWMELQCALNDLGVDI